MQESLMASRRSIGRREATPPSPDPVDIDAALLARIETGDRTAVGELYDRHSTRLFGLLLRVLRNRGDAEEILQQVFLRVLRKSEPRVEPWGSAFGWLAAIARRCAIEHLRTHGVCHSSGAPSPDSPAVIEPDAADSSEARQREAVESALATLSPVQRALIEHAYFSGATRHELSREFGVSIEEVNAHLRDGFITLRTRLASPAKLS